MHRFWQVMLAVVLGATCLLAILIGISVLTRSNQKADLLITLFGVPPLCLTVLIFHLIRSRNRLFLLNAALPVLAGLALIMLEVRVLGWIGVAHPPFPRVLLIISALYIPPGLLSVGAYGAMNPIRLAAGHCRNCEYDLTGNVSGVCPECGTGVPGPGADGKGASAT